MALHATYPLVQVSRFLHLTTPRHELNAAIGREHEDEVDTDVHFAAPSVPIAPHDRVPVDRAPSQPGKTAPAAKPPTVQKPAFDAARPLRVWIARRLARPGAWTGGPNGRRGRRRRSKCSAWRAVSPPGLSRPDLYNWFVRFGETISELRPTVVVFSFGADDAHDFMAGVPGGRKLGPLGSPITQRPVSAEAITP